MPINLRGTRPWPEQPWVGSEVAMPFGGGNCDYPAHLPSMGICFMLYSGRLISRCTS